MSKAEASGGSDVPFPLDAKFKIGTLNKRLGRGVYKAHQIAETVTITATGTLPNLQTVAKLEQLPLLIWPPWFGLFYYEPEIVLPAQHPDPFLEKQTIHSQDILKTITIVDVDGKHLVTIENF